MKKKTLTLPLLLLGGAACVLPAGCSSISKNSPEPVVKEEPFVDPIDYQDDDEKVVRLEQMAVMPAADEEVPVVNKVKLHYHNDDNGCLSRRFYTWVTGVDGVERKPEASTWTATDMEITLDFNEIPDYAGSISLFFIIKVAGTWAGQSQDTEMKYTDFPVVDGTMEVWTIPGEGTSIEMYATEAETQFPKIKTAKFTNFNTIHCVSTVDKEGKAWVPADWELYAFDQSYLTMTESSQKANKKHYLFKSSATSGAPSTSEFDIKFNYTAKINVQYVIESHFPGFMDRTQKVIVSSEYLYESSRFEQYYTYGGSDLGMTYSREKTIFKVWSPISANCTLNLYDKGAPKALGGNDIKRSTQMYYSKGGIWEITVLGDLAGKYYTYTLTNANGTVEAMDPYAKACGLNGMRGFVYDHNADYAKPDGWDEVPEIWDGKTGYDIKSPQELAIYEVHIRDFTAHSTWKSNHDNKRGTYNAFAESGTTLEGHPEIKTGFDHLTELGVNAVQLLPVFDYDNEERPDKNKFNWGYNPLNYNCVEGAYSSDPNDPLARIVEYKNLIMQLANNGNHTRVVMDVVYNHVMSASASCFTKIMPKYYFRYDSEWRLLDGSGCNNEVKSDAKMMSKYIVDSLLWWAKEYKIKGFRFDLMGLLDSWTMRAAKDALYAYDKDIYLYGEGWTSGGYHGKYEAEYNQDGSVAYIKEGGCETDVVYRSCFPSPSSPGLLGGFNNGGRDQLKGSNDNGYNGSPYPQWGFISQGSGDVGDKSSNVAYMIKGGNSYGIRGANPLQTVAYASCHDNYTLWDQLRFTLAPGGYEMIGDHHDVPVMPLGNAEPAAKDLVNATIGAHSMVFASNCAAFMQGGEELYRSKSATVEEMVEAGLMTSYEGENFPTAYDPHKHAEDIVRPFSDGIGNRFKHYSTNLDDVNSTSEVYMYGKITSHNSYKSPDLINAFDWSRKLSVDGYDTKQYIEKWSKMVETHKKSNKTSYIVGDEFFDEFNTWGNGNGSTGFALWNGNAAGNSGYKYAFSGRETAYIGWGDSLGGTLVYSNCTPTFKNGNIVLPPFSVVVVKVGA